MATILEHFGGCQGRGATALDLLLGHFGTDPSSMHRLWDQPFLDGFVHANSDLRGAAVSYS